MKEKNKQRLYGATMILISYACAEGAIHQPQMELWYSLASFLIGFVGFILIAHSFVESGY